MFLSYKKRFQTCLQMLDELRRQHHELSNETLSYAGVLDPMAEGWVTVLVGKDENRDRVRYTESIKEYEANILVGVGTDSGDLMGIVAKNNQDPIINNQKNFNQQSSINKFMIAVKNFPKSYQQKISKFANKKYKSKPLWWYQLHDVEVPQEALVKREVRILDREVLGNEEMNVGFLADEIGAMAGVFESTFRMDRIVPSWEKWFKDSEELIMKNQTLPLLRVRLVVSKGFFVRQWVQDLAQQLEIPLVVYSLKRTKVFDVSSR